MYRALKNEKDVKYILDNLRKEDKNEAIAVYGADYKAQILNNIMKTEFYVLLGKTKDSGFAQGRLSGKTCQGFESETDCLSRKQIQDGIPVCMGGIWGVIPKLQDSVQNCIAGAAPSPLSPPLSGGGETQMMNAGICWLVCTDKIKHHIKSLLKELKTEIEKADEQYAFIYNFIFKENKQMKKWLKGLGFIFDNAPAEKAGIKIPDGFEFFYRLNPAKNRLGGSLCVL